MFTYSCSTKCFILWLEGKKRASLGRTAGENTAWKIFCFSLKSLVMAQRCKETVGGEGDSLGIILISMRYFWLLF